MQFRLIGWSHFGFTADGGKYVEGYKFHISRPSTVSDFHGEEVASLTVSEQMVQRFGEPKVGQVYQVMYDQKGRLASYAPVQAQTKLPNT